MLALLFDRRSLTLTLVALAGLAVVVFLAGFGLGVQMARQGEVPGAVESLADRLPTGELKLPEAEGGGSESGSGGDDDATGGSARRPTSPAPQRWARAEAPRGWVPVAPGDRYGDAPAGGEADGSPDEEVFLGGMGGPGRPLLEELDEPLEPEEVAGGDRLAPGPGGSPPPAPPADDAPQPAAAERDAVTEPLPAAREVAQPSPPPVVPTGSFYIQVGAFANREYAHEEERALDERFRGRAYGPYLESVEDRRGRRLLAVRVGPFPDRSAAEAVATGFEEFLVRRESGGAS